MRQMQATNFIAIYGAMIGGISYHGFFIGTDDLTEEQMGGYTEQNGKLGEVKA